MVQADTTTVVPHPANLSLVVSRLKRALTPQAIAHALAVREVAQFVSFDFCCLLLSSNECEGAEDSWRAFVVARDSQDEATTKYFQPARLPFAALLTEDSEPRLLSDEELLSANGAFGLRARSALLLPLSTEGRPFGALCFANSSDEMQTTSGDTASLLSLADAVTLAAQSALYRERLSSAAEPQRELERLKRSFVNTLVCDVRLPLTNVLGLLELFESKLQAREPFDMEDRQLLGGAIEQGDRMRRIVDDLLEITRQQEQKLTLNLEHVEADALLEEAVEPFRAEAALRGVELNVRVSTPTPEFHVDIRQTRRALCYLLSVALAATPDGGHILVEAQTITGTRAGDEGRRFVIVNLTDSGEGISPEEIPFVFDAFSPAAGAQTNVARGPGLALTKRIAAAHGGNVAVRSQLGTGTTYSILLPAKTTEQHAAATTRHILVVDDAPELLLLLGKLVRRMGYQVTTAPNVARALEVMSEQKIDLLITDWAMPDANGGDLIAALKRDERWRRLPVVVLTGHDTDAERRDAGTAGCDRFLVKPIMRDELQRVINEMLIN
ncbi:MAG TPA: hybrid sensor histidine kinase/response regulator [Pyrinomonadaceae bacterium]|jgi:signal transduction histidine kinase